MGRRFKPGDFEIYDHRYPKYMQVRRDPPSKLREIIDEIVGFGFVLLALGVYIYWCLS